MGLCLDAFAAAAARRAARGDYDARPDAVPPAAGSFAKAVRGAAPPALVAEIKRRSPGGSDAGSIVVAARARAYARGGACACSVLTDADHFGGSLDDLVAARAADVPLLMKDFVVDVRQLDAAAAFGSSAVLAIVTMHDRGLAVPGLGALVDAAHDRGLEVLAEARTETELAAACATDADVLGVNARDLDTLRMEPDRCERVLAAYDDGRPALWLSGISTRADVERASRAGAAGVLVGSGLMRAADPEAAVRILVGGGAP